jgi:hypothetical protein
VVADQFILQHFHISPVLARYSGKAILMHPVPFQLILAGKPKPEAVVAAICAIAQELISGTERGFKSDVWAVGSIVFDEAVFVARGWLKLGSQSCQEKSVTT